MSPKINKYAFQNMVRKQRNSNSIFDKIKKANAILELFLKTSSVLLIIGILLGSFFLFNYLSQYKMVEIFSISIIQPKFLLFIAISSFIFAFFFSVVAIAGPYIYYYSIRVVKNIWITDNKERNIYIDTLIFLTPLSIPLITSQHEISNRYYVYVYIVVAIILSFIKFSLNSTSLGEINKEKIFQIISFVFFFVISIIILILPLYLIIKIIGSVEIVNSNKELMQFSLMLFVITLYSIISSIIVNNENSILLTILIICYVVFVSIFVFPKQLSNKLIQLTKIGQFEVFLALDPKLNLLKSENEQYRKFWVLINFQDSLIVSDNKDDKIFHVIPKSYIVDMKFDTQNDKQGKFNK